jgi:hypothetical protein
VTGSKKTHGDLTRTTVWAKAGLQPLRDEIWPVTNELRPNENRASSELVHLHSQKHVKQSHGVRSDGMKIRGVPDPHDAMENWTRGKFMKKKNSSHGAMILMNTSDEWCISFYQYALSEKIR